MWERLYHPRHCCFDPGETEKTRNTFRRQSAPMIQNFSSLSRRCSILVLPNCYKDQVIFQKSGDFLSQMAGSWFKSVDNLVLSIPWSFLVFKVPPNNGPTAGSTTSHVQRCGSKLGWGNWFPRLLEGPSFGDQNVGSSVLMEKNTSVKTSWGW